MNTRLRPSPRYISVASCIQNIVNYFRIFIWGWTEDIIFQTALLFLCFWLQTILYPDRTGFLPCKLWRCGSCANLKLDCPKACPGLTRSISWPYSPVLSLSLPASFLSWDSGCIPIPTDLASALNPSCRFSQTEVTTITDTVLYELEYQGATRPSF